MDKIKSQNLKEFLKEELKKVLKIFFLLYIFLFLVIETKAIIEKIDFSPKNKVSSSIQNPKKENIINKPNTISIPKINIEAPIIFVNSTQPKDFLKPLKEGVTHYPSALPGESGRTIILGHSAPSGWPKINYDWVFSNLNKLERGDEVFIFFNNQKYRYLVKEKIFLRKGQDLPSQNSDSELILISCWPPGIDNKRIGVLAELQS